MQGMGEKITIIGSDGREHEIDADDADLFFDGLTGEPISDEEWDEQKSRLTRNNIDLVPEESR